MKLKMAADQVLKRFSRQIRKEDALKDSAQGFNPVSTLGFVHNFVRQGKHRWIA
jgi:hypothetical protein